MDVEITPEPTPEEREALLAALAALDGPARFQSGTFSPPGWWRAGLPDDEEEVGDGL